MDPPAESAASSWPSTSTVTSTSRRAVAYDHVAVPRDDERPRVERVRRDERHGHRVEPPDEDGAAVREVVGRRSRRRRADDAVARDRAEALVADLPLELHHAAERRARRHDVVHRHRPLAAGLDVERGQLEHGVLAGERAREPCLEVGAVDRRQEADAAEVDAEHGDARAQVALQRPQHRSVAAQHDDDVGLLRHSSATISTPAPRQTPPAGRRASPITSGLPCVTTAARRTGSADCSCDPGIELIGKAGLFVVDEVEEELSVSLRAGKARVYDAGHAGVPAERRLRDVAQDARVNGRVADDAALRLRPARLELRLHERKRLPARGGGIESRRQRGPQRDERDVARDELGRVRKLGQVARVHALEDGHARVVAQPRMKLAVADVERDHVRRAVLEQAVGEAAGGRADVEAAQPVRGHAEGFERVLELLTAAGDVARRPLDDELRVLRDLLARLLHARERARRARAPAPAHATPRGRAPRAGRRAASSHASVVRRCRASSAGMAYGAQDAGESGASATELQKDSGGRVDRAAEPQRAKARRTDGIVGKPRLRLVERGEPSLVDTDLRAGKLGYRRQGRRALRRAGGAGPDRGSSSSRSSAPRAMRRSQSALRPSASRRACAGRLAPARP